MRATVHTAISPSALDIGDAIARVTAPECGGVAIFIGTVRASGAVVGHEGDEVQHLDYDAHPDLAATKIRAVADDAAGRFEVRHVVAVHRTGRCELSEPTVVVATSAAHRADALDACRYIINAIKSSVPIWKREVYEGKAESAWVGAEAPRRK